MSISHKIKTAFTKAKNGEFFSHAFDKIMLYLIRNKNVFSEYKKVKAYYKLKKQYAYLLNADNETERISGNSPLKIWTCWFQGEENAPSLVKSCIASMRNLFGNDMVTVITDENFTDYVELPDYILQKYRKGIISRAHFSDILRIELLHQHGGLWLDSTVFCTCKSVPEYIEKSDLFVYKNINLTRNDANTIVASSWLMKANRHNCIIAKTRELLFEYWKKQKKLENYYLVHIFFTFATEVYAGEWRNIPTFSNVPPHIMQFEILDVYSEKRFAEMAKGSGFHKLNWKIQPETNAEKYTFYNFLTKDFGEK